MNSTGFYDSTLFLIDNAPTTKDEVLKYIAAVASAQPALAAYTQEELFETLNDREKVGSTGCENGIALPHCSLADAADFVTGVLVVPNGVAFGAGDGQKSLIFAFILGPTAARSAHIQLLSAFSRILIDKEAIGRIAASKDSVQLKEVFLERALKIEDSSYLTPQKPKNLILMILQNKQYFDDFLQIFAATENVAITIMESNNAGNFLHRMPLFASFWSESQTSFNKVIMGIVDRDKSNDLIRRLNTGLKNYEKPKGVMITVQELSYTFGSLEL